MTAFTSEEETEDRLDSRILRDGSICLYRNNQFLEDDVSWLRSNGYRIVSFDCANWSSSDLMHDSLKSVLSFPSYYGRNLDALDECMSEDLEVPEVDGLVLVLKSEWPRRGTLAFREKGSGSSARYIRLRLQTISADWKTPDPRSRSRTIHEFTSSISVVHRPNGTRASG
jgi:RNAse (barnase) inhibitor barstar